MGRPYIDMAGQAINGIKILSLVEEKGGAGRHRRWNCICPVCGKEFIVASQHLRDKKDPIMMCRSCSIHQYKDLVGRKFGRLTVISRDLNSDSNRIKFICKCDCGSMVSVQANHLASEEIHSCGCLLSNGEDVISDYLTKHNIEFEKQKAFDDCAVVRSLKFDFYISQINTAIEYQGIQHFEPVKFFGGEEDFKTRVAYDNIKKEYCDSHNINLYYINYNDDIEDKLDRLLQSEDMVWPHGNMKD